MGAGWNCQLANIISARQDQTRKSTSAKNASAKSTRSMRAKIPKRSKRFLRVGEKSIERKYANETVSFISGTKIAPNTLSPLKKREKNMEISGGQKTESKGGFLMSGGNALAKSVGSQDYTSFNSTISTQMRSLFVSGQVLHRGKAMRLRQKLRSACAFVQIATMSFTISMVVSPKDQ